MYERWSSELHVQMCLEHALSPNDAIKNREISRRSEKSLGGSTTSQGGITRAIFLNISLQTDEFSHEFHKM